MMGKFASGHFCEEVFSRKVVAMSKWGNRNKGPLKVLEV